MCVCLSHPASISSSFSTCTSFWLFGSSSSSLDVMRIKSICIYQCLQSVSGGEQLVQDAAAKWTTWNRFQTVHSVRVFPFHFDNVIFHSFLLNPFLWLSFFSFGCFFSLIFFFSSFVHRFSVVGLVYLLFFFGDTAPSPFFDTEFYIIGTITRKCACTSFYGKHSVLI